MTTNRGLTTDPGLTNLLGPLDATMRRRLREVLRQPRKYWHRDHGIILRGNEGLGLTLWQAVLRVDGTFPRTGPVSDRDGRVLEGWARFPDTVLIGRAIRYALGRR